jgi:metal-sulfur cluster biosynthetic enzyme
MNVRDAQVDLGSLELAVDEAIEMVDDPCSIAVGVPLSVRDLGLIRRREVAGDGVVRITVSPTAQSCILIGSIVRGLEQRVGEVAGVHEVQVQIDTSTVWTPELMSERGRLLLKRSRRRSLEHAPVRPRQWEDAV